MKRTCLVIMALLTFALAGCGSTALSAASSTTSTVLQVERIATITENYYSDFDRTITNANAILHLYHAALALPKVLPGTVMDCSEDAGVMYHLTFEFRSSTRQMTLDASGCHLLTMSKTDVRITNQSFITLVQQVIGIPCLLATNVSADGQVQSSMPNDCSDFIR